MQKFSQAIAEAILPILGFYYWDWSWYFIFLFYSLDVIAKEVIINLQSQKIYQTQGGQENLHFWKKSAIKSGIMGVGLLWLFHFLEFLRNPTFSIGEEVTAFFFHKEMGIPQGYLLLPLILLNVWMQYKLQFLKQGMHLRMKMSQLWNDQLRYRFLVIGIVALGLGLHSFIQIKDAVLLWTAVILPFLYAQFFQNPLKN
jgi:hypothetical protein